jgi:hypothetical protein
LAFSDGGAFYTDMTESVMMTIHPGTLLSSLKTESGSGGIASLKSLMNVDVLIPGCTTTGCPITNIN